ncbi:Flavinator of succinate dehydrogenase-domain-containing protein [Mariannaea sp. PMI_226]|nr:Flavinator of succinate dehydrogenase-domain-containing protein [Mariannaea sp. PMI_226]
MASLASRALRRPVAARQLLAAAAATAPIRSMSMTAPRRANDESQTGELGVGELQGAKFRIEPLRRVGENDDTKRARLVYQSRKRGILESDLLLSTFASKYLPTLSPELLDQYDLLLDENDWDIYYWATQKEELSSTNPSSQPTSDEVARHPPKGEWAQTVGNFRPAYRPVPVRWKDSEILAMLREHVRSRSVNGAEGTGMKFMPELEFR